jgi:hypothetical protein
MLVQLIHMARLLLVLSGLMVMGCATWQGMYGSGHLRSIVAAAVPAADAGTSATTTVLSRTGTAAARTARTAAEGFGCVVECFSFENLKNIGTPYLGK